jgi:hypothetical protein
VAGTNVPNEPVLVGSASDNIVGTSPPMLPCASPRLLAASSTRSIASSEFDVNCRRATDV